MWLWLAIVDGALLAIALVRVVSERLWFARMQRSLAAQLAEHGRDVVIVGATDHDVALGAATKSGYWEVVSAGFTIELDGRRLAVPPGVPLTLRVRDRGVRVVDRVLHVSGGSRWRAVLDDPDRVEDGPLRTMDALPLDQHVYLTPEDVASREAIQTSRLSWRGIGIAVGVYAGIVWLGSESASFAIVGGGVFGILGFWNLVWDNFFAALLFERYDES